MQQVLLQGIAFLYAETVDDIQGLVKGLRHLGDEGFIVILHWHIEDARHPEECGCQIARGRDAQFGRNLLNLFLVGFHNVLVDMVGLGQIRVGDCDHHIYLATLQLGSDSITEIQLCKAKLVGQLHLKVQLLAVQSLDFNRYFFGMKSLLGNAVASHGTNHNFRFLVLFFLKSPIFAVKILLCIGRNANIFRQIDS